MTPRYFAFVLPVLLLLPAAPAAAQGVTGALEKARASGDLEKITGRHYFVRTNDEGEIIALSVNVEIDEDSIETELFLVNSDLEVMLSTHTMNQQGRLWDLSVRLGHLKKLRLASVTGTVQDGKLHLRIKKKILKPARKKSMPLPADTLPYAMALFVLPSISDHISGKPKLTPMAGWKIKDPWTLDPQAKQQEREDQTKEEKTLTYTSPEGKVELVVWVSTAAKDRGKVLALKAHKGEYLIRVTEQDLKSYLKKAEKYAEKIPMLGEARRNGNEAAAIGALKTITTSQSLFREGDKDGDGTYNYAGSMKALGDTSLIDSVLASGRKQGYEFELCAGKKEPEFTWMAVARPIKPGSTGIRYFATNHEGVVYYSLKPIQLDRENCTIPKDCNPVGK